MQVFKPKHCNYFFNHIGEVLYIASNNSLVITKKSSRYVRGTNYQSTNVYTQNILNSYVCFGYYDYTVYGHINYDNIVRNQLSTIDNAISVCYALYSFVILLDTGKLVYIISDPYFDKIVKINKILESINVEYISNTDTKLIVYSENNLYIIDINGNIETYENVMGYLASSTTILIYYNNLKIEYLSDNTLYLLNSVGTIYSIYADDILRGSDSNLISSINIINCKIYIVIDGILRCYLLEGSMSNNLVSCKSGVVSMHTTNNVDFCYYDDNVLLFKILNADSEIECCLDVIKYLFIIDFLVCIHSDSTITVIQYKVSKIDRDIYNGLNQNLYVFLTDPKNFEVVNRIDKFIDYELDGNTIILIYLTFDNILEFLNIETLEFVILNTFLTVESETEHLQLLKYDAGSYI